MKILFVTVLALIMSVNSYAGSMRYGFNEFEYEIGYVEISPLNNGKFSIYFNADKKRFLIVDSNNQTVEFGYADASAFKRDLLKKTTLGFDAGLRISCSEHGVKINNGVVTGCVLTSL